MDNLLQIEPQTLSFPYELGKEVSCTIRLSNMTWNYVAFKIRKRNTLRDPTGELFRPGQVLMLNFACSAVTTRLLKALPPEQHYTDKLQIHSAFASPYATTEDDVRKLTRAGSHVQVCKLRVVYTFPSRVPAPVVEALASSSIASWKEYTNSSDLKLLNITPSELQFPFELKKELSCSLQLANRTKNHVFFKVKATHPKKYSVQPHIGIVVPRSTCDVIVRMQPQTKFPVDKECKDKFLIQSVVGSPRATKEELTSEMFDEPWRFVEEFKLRVVYTFPSRPQSLTNEESKAGSSSDASKLPHMNSRDLEVRQGLDRNESIVSPWFKKGITIGLLSLVFWKMLPLMWSVTFLIMMLVVKMIKSIVSDSIEDWIVKCLVYVCIHFLSVIFGRKAT